MDTEVPGAGFRSDGGESANDSSIGGGGGRTVPGPNVKGAPRPEKGPVDLVSATVAD